MLCKTVSRKIKDEILCIKELKKNPEHNDLVTDSMLPVTVSKINKSYELRSGGFVLFYGRKSKLISTSLSSFTFTFSFFFFFLLYLFCYFTFLYF